MKVRKIILISLSVLIATAILSLGIYALVSAPTITTTDSKITFTVKETFFDINAQVRLGDTTFGNVTPVNGTTASAVYADLSDLKTYDTSGAVATNQTWDPALTLDATYRFIEYTFSFKNVAVGTTGGATVTFGAVPTTTTLTGATIAIEKSVVTTGNAATYATADLAGLTNVAVAAGETLYVRVRITLASNQTLKDASASFGTIEIKSANA